MQKIQLAAQHVGTRSLHEGRVNLEDDRFQIREHLDFYTDPELAEIVQRNAKKLSVEIDSESAMDIACRAAGRPTFKAVSKLSFIMPQDPP